MFNYDGRRFGDLGRNAHLLYLAREAISNVVRHAQASSVKIEVARSEDRIVLSVVDDGIGFSMPSRPQRGRGLRNMAERARLDEQHLSPDR